MCECSLISIFIFQIRRRDVVSKINIFKEYFLQLFRIEIDILFVKTIETVSSQVFVQRVSRHIVWKIIS